MPLSDVKQAIIYCRVSSAAQLQKGDGLASQETRCRQYATSRGYQVCQVFKDEGASGGLIDRPAMQKMLTFLRKENQQYIVLIDDISRLARGLEAHMQLRTAISTAGGKLESPSIEFGEDSDSVLVEHLLASVSQHQRQKNAEQTLNRMIARVMNGYWVFNPPLGYRYTRVPEHSGQVLIRDEPIASVIVEALEGFASGRFESQSEVKRFLDKHPLYPKDNSGEVRFQRVSNLLRKVIYSGFIEVPKWNISLRQGKHEALINFETFQHIQARLNLKVKPQAAFRKDQDADFPLRGFVHCAACDHAMTACWSKGRKTKYPYYMCFQKGCACYRKSIKRDQLENDFEALLDTATPAPPVFSMAEAMFRELWDNKQANQEVEKVSLERELQAKDKQVNSLVDRIVNTDNKTLIDTYESKLSLLEKEKLVLAEKVAQCGRVLPCFDESFRTAMDFLENPHKLWASERLEDKQTVLKLVFSQPLAYDRNLGFRTADFALPFKALQTNQRPDYDMAEKEGFEPSIEL